MIERDGQLLPSETCTLPTPEHLHETIADLHTRLIDAAEQPIVGQGRDSYGASGAKWELVDGGLTVSISKEGQFTSFPSLQNLQPHPDPLREDYDYTFFEISVTDGSDDEARYTHLEAYYEGGQLVLAPSRNYPIHSVVPIDDERLTAGQEWVRAFVAGEREPDRVIFNRSIHVYLGEPKVTASETIICDGTEITVTSKLEVEQPGARFAATMRNGESTGITYHDGVEYSGIFGVNFAKEQVPYGQERVRIPRRPGATRYWQFPRLPESAEQDAAINQTRNVLTTGRFKEVAAIAEGAIALLDDHHQTYLEKYGPRT